MGKIGVPMIGIALFVFWGCLAEATPETTPNPTPDVGSRPPRDADADTDADADADADDSGVFDPQSLCAIPPTGTTLVATVGGGEVFCNYYQEGASVSSWAYYNNQGEACAAAPWAPSCVGMGGELLSWSGAETPAPDEGCDCVVEY